MNLMWICGESAVDLEWIWCGSGCSPRSMAWLCPSMVWLCPSMGIMWRPLGKMTFFAKMMFFSQFFSEGAQIACKSRRTTSHVFWLFTPLFRRFRLSGVVLGEELFEIYRFVSSILHFMPSGSISENLSKIYRKSIENLSKICRKSIEHLSEIYRKSIEHLSKIYRKSIENLSKIYRKSMEWWATLGLLWVNFASSRRLWRLM